MCANIGDPHCDDDIMDDRDFSLFFIRGLLCSLSYDIIDVYILLLKTAFASYIYALPLL